MIEVTGKIILDQVYDNGLHSLTRFEIKNTTDLKLTVKLRSNLTKIAFQKSNENLPDQLQVENTNTVEYCMARTNTGFNQLFNFVGHIDQIDLEPFQTQKIIIAFLPTTEPNTPTIFKEDATHDFIEINGLLFFFCFKKDKLGLVKQDSKAILEKPIVSPKIGRTNTDPAKNIDGDVVIPPDFQVTTKFKSRICKSVFTTDISSTGLIFDDCVVGGTYFKDFTVHNRSEIMLFWTLTSVDLSNKNHKNWLKFTDYDTGEPLDFSPLAAYTPKRIRVSFKPTDVGEFNYELQIENQNDASNTVQTHVHAIVRSVMREEKLIISTGNMLDFGDCCAGLMKKKFIILRNVSESPLEIGFSSDSPDVVFQLKSEEVQTYEPIRSRQHSKQMSEPLHRDSFDISDGLLEPPEKLLHDRLTEISGVSRTHSELSITRTHSSSSSVGSSPGYPNGEDQDVPLPNIVEALRSNHDSVSRTMSEDYDSFSSFDLPYNKDVGILGEEITRIEELILRPGIEKHIEVCYLPQRDPITSDYRSCRLSKRNFRVTLSSCKPGQQNNSEKNIIQCVSKVCTSAIEVSPSTINFGDTNVSTLKSAPLIVRNMSDLPTLIELRYVSKVLSSFRGEIVIPAKQSVEVKIDIYPRKVNPDYKKDITVANLFNPDNDQIVQVHSTNIDQQKVTFHSLFYNILTPAATNFIDFGTALINSPVVRTFIIENISDQDLVLELSNSMPGDIGIYGVAEYNPTVLPRNSERKEKLLESIEDRRKLNRPSTESKVNSLKAAQSTSGITIGSVTLKSRRNMGDITQAVASPDYLDLASSNKVEPPRSPSRRKNTYTVPLRSLRSNFTKKNSAQNDDDVSDVSGTYEDVSLSDNLLCKPDEKVENAETTKFAMDTLLPLLEKETGMISPHFTNYESEEKYVKTQQTIRRELDDCIRDAQLVPLSRVTVGPQKQLTIILVFKSNNQNLSSLQGKARKYDARVFFKMIEFDRTIKAMQFDYLLKKENADKIPIREMMVRSLVAKSLMELGQKHINFGNMDKTERRTKKIVIRNKSEVPLIYGIRKSGSIASGDLIFSEGKYGVIRGYGKREVEFMFDPSLAGLFQENLTIENIQNPDNNQTLIVKANIRQPANFFIENLLLSFGPCLIDQVCQNVQNIVISNTSTKHTRIFEVKVDPQELVFEQCSGEIWFSIDSSGEDEDGNQKVLLSKEMEERIEQLEQKHKIAVRKGRQDKADKIMEELKLLRAGKVAKSENEKQEDSSPVALNTTKSAHTSAKDLLAITSNTVPKVKTTDCSIIFPIGPRCVKTVKVFFKPSRISRISIRGSPDFQSDTSYSKFESSSLPSNPSLSAVGTEDTKSIDSEICTARIYIHEQKNTDIVKRVLVKSTVCYDQQAYLRVLQEEQDVSRKSETDNGFQFDTPVISSMPSTTTSQNLPQSPIKNFIPEVATPKFTVEMQLVDLGKLEIGEKKHCYFVLINQSDRDLRFILDIPRDLAATLYAKKQAGILKANETRKIELTLIPRSLGRLKATIHVQDSRKSQKISITYIYYATLSSYLRLNFNSHERINHFGLADVKQGNYELDFGYCYIDYQKRFAKVVPIEVENITDNPIVLSAVSNLSQQCYIFADNLLENSLSSNPITLNGNEKVIVYIALQPGLVSTGSASLLKKLEKPFNIQTDAKLASQIDCRNLIGGIRFMIFVKDNIKELDSYPASSKVVSNPDNFVNVFTHTLKFNAAIGQSFFAVSDKVINFGSKCSKGQLVRGKFWVYNLTSSMPLQFQLQPSSGIIIEDFKGCIGPVESSSQTGSNIQGECVTFSLMCAKYGFYNESIVCKNMNNLNQNFEVSVRAFCNPTFVSCSVLNQKRVEDDTMDIIRWENVYSSVVQDGGASYLRLQKKSRTDSMPLYENSVELKNNTDELIHLQAYSDIGLNFRWMINVGSGFVVDNLIQNTSEVENSRVNNKLAVLGSALLLQPKEKAIAVISVTSLNMLLDENNASTVNLGKRFIQDGILVFKNVDKQVDVAAFELSVGYCQSVGSIETNIIDLGKVGHINMWQEVKFQFKIHNPSEITYLYDFEIPDYVEITSIGNENENIPSKRKIEPGCHQVIECQFNPRQVQERISGAQSGTITIKNIFNPSNDLTVTLKYFMTQFELKFDRLNSGELQLPPLIFPSSPSALPCDNWFVITNVADQDVKFDIGCTLTPDVESLISTEILSRNSNSPIGTSVSLPSKGSIEVKIRIAAKDAIRLSQGMIASSYLTNPAGVTLGTFWLTSKVKQSIDGDKENTLKLVESVALRGVFVEGPTFTLSESSLTFKTIVLSDSDDDKKPQSTQPALTIQKQNISVTNLSNNYTLDLKVAIEYPIEFASAAENIIEISPLKEDGTFQVEAGGQITITFSLRDSKIYGISDDIKVHFIDKNSLSKKGQTVSIKLLEDNTGMLQSTTDYTDDVPTKLFETRTSRVMADVYQNRGTEDIPIVRDELTLSPEIQNFSLKQESAISYSAPVPPVLEIKGCKKLYDITSGKFEGFYELDLGQQDLSPTALSKKITIELTTGSQASYRICPVNEKDSDWIVCNRYEGLLEMSRSNSFSASSQQITLSLMVALRGTYYAYLMIQNLDNYMDTKFVRVTMEVVAKQNLKRSTNNTQTEVAAPYKADLNNNKVFQVYTHAIESKSSTIDMGMLSFGAFYVTKSLVIFNHELTPLEFSVTSNLPRDDESELIFSLSRSGAKLFSTIRIEGGSSCQVFLRLLLMPSSKIGAQLEDYVEHKDIEIYVNCRLVKDYQKVIPLKALCTPLQMTVSPNDFVFSCAVSKKANNEIEALTPQQIQCDNDILAITNNSDKTLEFHIICDSIYFDIELHNPGPAAKATSPHHRSYNTFTSRVLHYLSGKKRNNDDSSDSDEDTPTANTSSLSKLSFSHGHQGLITCTLEPKATKKYRIIPLLNNINKHIEQLRKQKYIMDHFVLYNKKKPHERQRLYVRLSFGHLKTFQFASDSLNHFHILESHCIRLLRQIATLPGLLNDIDSDAFFLYRYIVDELIHYGTREQAAYRYLHLGSLLFKSLFTASRGLLPSFITPNNFWIAPFVSFLSFFPRRNTQIEPLVELAKVLVPQEQ